MKGKIDISRDTFRKEYHYNKVQMQQGRVQVDADWNEQVDIQDYHNKTTLRDIIGKTGTPIESPGFAVTISTAGKLMIEPGRYYVDGILIENEKQIEIINQIDLPVSLEDKKEGKIKSDDGKYLVSNGTYLLYLDVWERPVIALDAPEISESALNGVDTATRSKIIWQVKLLHVKDGITDCASIDSWDILKPPATSTLQAFCKPEEPATDRCMIPPGAGYRGLENQLYRVEVNNPGKAGEATIKWSVDNGIVVTRLTDISGEKLSVTSSGKDKLLGFAIGDWVEVTDDFHELLGIPGTLLKLTNVKDNKFYYKVSSVVDPPTNEKYPQEFNPKIRKWDSDGLIDVKVLSPIQLKDGIEITFKDGTLYTGNYWLIPARTIKGNIEWPLIDKTPAFLAPEGIEHHYCSLALVQYLDSNFNLIADCRKFFPPLVDLTKSPEKPVPTGDPLVHTGLINLGFKNDQEVSFTKFKHFYKNLESPPPAIILGFVGAQYIKRTDGTDVFSDGVTMGTSMAKLELTSKKVFTSMEDYCLYTHLLPGENAPKIPEFKPVNVNQTTFDVNVSYKDRSPDAPIYRLVSVILRWWAIPAMENALQKQTAKS